MDDFLIESKAHGWPSFRDQETNWEYVRVLRDGECVSVDGTHLGHNLPDRKGNRYCISKSRSRALSRSLGLCFGRKKQLNLENSPETHSKNSLLFSFSRFGFGGWEQKLGDGSSEKRNFIY